MTSLYATIQALAMERGLSLSGLADRMGVNRKTLCSCVNGNPRLSRLQNIADTLNVRLSDIIAIAEDVEGAEPRHVE